MRVTVNYNRNRREPVRDKVMQVVLRIEKVIERDQKGVVYYRSKGTSETLAEKLGCEFYHSGIVDEKERQGWLQRWVTGEGSSRWITAITGLGTGVDIPGIMGVIHMEQPYGLVDFI